MMVEIIDTQKVVYLKIRDFNNDENSKCVESLIDDKNCERWNKNWHHLKNPRPDLPVHTVISFR